MSDGPRFSNPGNGGNGGYNDDVFRWSGDTQRPAPGQQQGNSGDRYIYDGSGRGQVQGGDDNDAFRHDRMPGRVRDGNGGDYAQTVVQRETRLDGTIIYNIVHANRVIFNQGDGGSGNSGYDQGADYRRNPQQDFRSADPDCARLQQRSRSNYYDGDRQNDYRYNQNNYRDNDMYMQDSRQQQIAALRERQMMQSREREREIEMMRAQQYQQQCEREQQIEAMSRYHRNVDEQLRIQIYNDSARRAMGHYPEPAYPYYGNDGCFGNNGSRYGGYDRYDSQYGGPCFGRHRSGISISVGVGPIRVGF